MARTEDQERAYARQLLARRTERDLDEITEDELTAEVIRILEYGALLDSPITHDEAARLAWPSS